MKGNIFSLFLQEKPCAIINVLRISKGNNISAMAKKSNCTYSHTRKILLFMKKGGFINFEKQGKIHKINLTEKGEKIAERIEKIKELLI